MSGICAAGDRAKKKDPLIGVFFRLKESSAAPFVMLVRIVRKEQTSNILRIVRKGQSTKQAPNRQQTPRAVIN